MENENRNVLGSGWEVDDWKNYWRIYRALRVNAHCQQCLEYDSFILTQINVIKKHSIWLKREEINVSAEYNIRFLDERAVSAEFVSGRLNFVFDKDGFCANVVGG